MASPPPDPFAPRAAEELLAALDWITREGRADVARRLLEAATAAAERVVAKPSLARAMPALAPPRYCFWSLRGFPYLLVVDTEREPPVVARFLHQSRDLPAALGRP